MKKLITICLLVTVMAVSPRIASAGPTGYSVRSDVDDHLYSIDLGTGVATDLGAVGNSDVQGIALVGGYLYGIGGTVDEFWNLTFPPGYKIGDTGSRSGVDAGLSYDPTTGKLYNSQRSVFDLYEINIGTGAATLIGSGTGGSPDGLAINSSGAAYALDGINDKLFTVNLSTGALSLIGTGIGVDLLNEVGLSFDPASGTLYAITDGGAIYTMNTSTGLAKFVTNVTLGGQNIGGFESLAVGAVIPAPGAILLGSIGVGIVGWLRRRRTL